MKKIVISGPILSRSGYGVMAQFAYRSLKDRTDVDLYVMPTSWGNTGWLHEDNEERKHIDSLIVKTQLLLQQTNNQPNFDVAIQISIPNEWKKMAPINIGYTAGIETNLISPAWLQPSQQMDKIIVISEHAKAGFVNTIFGNPQGQQFKVTTPVEVVHLPYRNSNKKPLDLSLKHDFNFLAVCQWGPRKNLEQTIVGFLEEFKGEEVGLVLKINTANDSIIDRTHTQKRLEQLLTNYPDRKCTITLLHGHLREEEMEWIYTHPKIKAIVSTTHGEGFGLPLLEAAANELPVLATDWSGHTDFLYMPDGEEKKRMFGKIDYELKPIEQAHVWQGVLEAGTQWAYPKMVSYKDRLRDCYKDYGRYKSQAKKLAPWIKENFNEQKLQIFFFKNVIKINNNVDEEMVFLNLPQEQINEVKKISFCISTNAKKLDITKKAINSIKRTCKLANIENSEIIVCGNIEKFTNIEGISLVNAYNEANTGMLAKMRNMAAEKASGDVLVFLDDDIIFDEKWALRIQEYSKQNGWNVLGNRILLPDGGRYWDRATINPHVMVNYEHDDKDPSLYQTGCFWIIRKELFDKHKWDSSIEYYAEKNGKTNEDVEYSNRLKKLGYILRFDKNNLVWHYDNSYQEIELNNDVKICLKKEQIPQNLLTNRSILNEISNLFTSL